MIFGAGVDVGSTQTKAVIVDEARRIVARTLIPTGANVTRAGENAFVRGCEEAGLSREAVRYVVGTGYGRYKVTFGDAQITEITCHARGAHSIFPATRTVIDMPVRLTSVCTVFVESDIMSYLAQRKTIEDILGGVHKAIATRTMSLVRRVGVEDEVTFTGGVSRNVGMVRALEAVLGRPINVSADGHFIGALGAALFALARALVAGGVPAPAGGGAS